jgi:hypothetical protein
MISKSRKVRILQMTKLHSYERLVDAYKQSERIEKMLKEEKERSKL